ncbi:MAG: MerR family transcriptional regulator [Rhizomicrobium sp.]
MRIGALAARAGITASRVRFYEVKGLLPRPPRRANGYRDYGEPALATLLLIRRARRLGYTLAEIGIYLDAPHGEGRKALLLACIEGKLAQFDEMLAQTRSRRASLQKLREELRQAGVQQR